MTENFDECVSGAPRMRWNDIRIVGPVLVAMLLAVSLLSPTFASADQSVGSPTVVDDDYIFDPCLASGPDGAAAMPAVFIVSECCPDLDLVKLGVGGPSISEICPPEPAVAEAVKRPVYDPPAPIMGPIWLGATTASVPQGSIVLHIPTLLGMFIEGNQIRVTNSDGEQVHVGRLSSSDTLDTTMAYAGGTVELTIKTTLKTGAEYTEVVTVSFPLN